MSTEIGAALGEAADHLTVAVQNGVATIEVHRPAKHNAISFAMWHAFGRLMPVLADDDDVDVVVMRGTPGGPFSAGADIAEFKTLRADPEGARNYGEAVEAGEQAIIRFPKPTVALVEGFAIGGGAQLAVACDLRVCGNPPGSVSRRRSSGSSMPCRQRRVWSRPLARLGLAGFC